MNDESPSEDHVHKKLLSVKKPTKLVHQKLLHNKRGKMLKSQSKRIVDCDENKPVNWLDMYMKPFQCTKITKLLAFQLHTRLSPNIFLKQN